MKKQIYSFLALLLLNMLSFVAASQTKKDSLANDIPIGIPSQETNAGIQSGVDSATIDVLAEKLLQRLNNEVQLTPEQYTKLKPLHVKKAMLQARINETLPQDENFKKLRTELKNLNIQINALLSSEQQSNLKTKKNAGRAGTL